MDVDAKLEKQSVRMFFLDSIFVHGTELGIEPCQAPCSTLHFNLSISYCCPHV